MAKQKFDIKNLSLGVKKAEEVEKVVKEIAKSTTSTPKTKKEAEAVEEKKKTVKPVEKTVPKLAKSIKKKRAPKVYAHSLLSEETRRFTMDIPRKLYMKIKISAAEQDMTMKELVLEAVREVYDK